MKSWHILKYLRKSQNIFNWIGIRKKKKINLKGFSTAIILTQTPSTHL